MYKIIVLCLVFLWGCHKSTPMIQNTPNNFEQVSLYAEVETDKQFESDIVDIKELVNLNYKEIKDVLFWNEDIQKGIYLFFLENNNIEALLDFKSFIDSLDREIYQLYEHGENQYSSSPSRPNIINPIMVIIENSFMEKETIYFFSQINNKMPNLFLVGNRNDWGMYTNPPIIQATIKGNYTVIQFFIENKINWKESQPRSRDSGSEYGLGGNILTYLPVWDNNRRIHNYFVEQGIEEEIDISDQVIMVAYGLDFINIWSEPRFNSEIICQVNKEKKLNPIKITAYKINNCQWVYFETGDGIQGWAPYSISIDYDSGM
ncbi:hypothetical protein LQZ19_16260 [Treponema primitia]|uniref:hypothetical protein n=1 Tax=Treponema primitia TaxID=88058 RepID=UPI003980E905